MIFLAEAFTKPAMMHELAKVGFNQCYTYFTWRNASWELKEYMTELATVDADYFRPNFFVNTPDILHEYLQDGGRPAFEARLVLAATLSPSYGVYSGYENIENVPVRPGSEEYLDSEKYELKQRTIEGPLLPLIERLNEIRRAQPLAAADRQRHLPRDRERQPDRLREAGRGRHADRLREPRPGGAARGAARRPAGSRPAGLVRRAGSADRRDLRLAGRRQLRPPPARRRARHARPMSQTVRSPDSPNPNPDPELDPARTASGSLRRRSGSRPTRSGSSARSSTRSTSAASPTATTTAPATCAASTEKLDYLQWLGVDCIWLLPMYPSPLRDGGYDIADFYSIHPDYGTVEDFRALIDGAHERGIRVIADLVMNHTSSDHPWFQEARAGPDVARSATGTSGRTPTSATPRCGSSSSTPRSRTGRGTRSPASTTGTASSRTSPT